MFQTDIKISKGLYAKEFEHDDNSRLPSICVLVQSPLEKQRLMDEEFTKYISVICFKIDSTEEIINNIRMCTRKPSVCSAIPEFDSHDVDLGPKEFDSVRKIP